MSPFYIRFISLSCFYHSFLSIIFFWIPALCSAFLFVCVVFVHLPKYIYTNVFLFHVKKIIRELDKFSLKLCCMVFGPLFILLGYEFIIIYGSSVDVLSVAVKICLPTNIRSHYGWHFSSAIYLLLPCLMSIYFLKCDFSHSVNLPCESKSTQLIFSSSVRSFLIYVYKKCLVFFCGFSFTRVELRHAIGQRRRRFSNPNEEKQSTLFFQHPFPLLFAIPCIALHTADGNILQRFCWIPQI